jgi:hypothetical protein
MTIDLIRREIMLKAIPTKQEQSRDGWSLAISVTRLATTNTMRILEWKRFGGVDAVAI